MSATAKVENATEEQQPTEAPAAEKSPAKEKKTKAPKKPKATKPKTASHPPYFEMIKEALLALNERSGSSPYAIAKYTEEKYKAVLPANFRKILGIQLKNSAARGKLVKVKASYKLSAKKPAKKQPTEKPGNRETMKRSAIANASCSREAEEEAFVGKEEKTYVYVPWLKRNKKASPMDEEAVMADLFGMGPVIRAMRNEELRKEAELQKKICKEEWEREREMEKEGKVKRKGKEGEVKKKGKVKRKGKEGEVKKKGKEEEVKNKQIRKEEMGEEGKKKAKEEEEEKKELRKKFYPRHGHKRMTNELRDAWKKYRRQVLESQGFDFDRVPGAMATIVPYYLFKYEKDSRLNDKCREALAKFNSLNRSDYEFVKVEKANKRVCAGLMFFITFQARKLDTGSLVTFETRVYDAIDPRRSRVDFCRLKKGN